MSGDLEDSTGDRPDVGRSALPGFLIRIRYPRRVPAKRRAIRRDRAENDIEGTASRRVKLVQDASAEPRYLGQRPMNETANRSEE